MVTFNPAAEVCPETLPPTVTTFRALIVPWFCVLASVPLVLRTREVAGVRPSRLFPAAAGAYLLAMRSRSIPFFQPAR